MESIMSNGEYFLVEGIGQYWNKRYEVLKKDFYYDNNGEKIITWVLVGKGADYKKVEEIYNKRIDK